MRPRSPSRRDRRGSAAVEFALMLPVVMLISSAVLDYSWYLHRSADVLTAVRDGVRFGATVTQTADPTSEAIDRTTTSLGDMGITCGSGTDCDVSAELDAVSGMVVLRVTSRVDYTPIIGLVPTPESMSATLVMALEDQTES
jgi:Flp pilus assembly protein TadG